MLFIIQIHPTNVDINITAVQIYIYTGDIYVTILNVKTRPPAEPGSGRETVCIDRFESPGTDDAP